MGIGATRKLNGQAPIVIGIIALAVAGIALRLHLDFLAGVGFGIAIPSFFIGFRSLQRK
jgi:hypothetical protein